MTRNPDEEESIPTILDHTKAAVRTVVAGHEQASVRRITLWVILFALLALSWAWSPAALVAVIPATLLALTDQLV